MHLPSSNTESTSSEGDIVHLQSNGIQVVSVQGDEPIRLSRFSSSQPIPHTAGNLSLSNMTVNHSFIHHVVPLKPFCVTVNGHPADQSYQIIQNHMICNLNVDPSNRSVELRVAQFGTNDWCRAVIEQTNQSININLTQSTPSRTRLMLGALERSQRSKRRREIDDDLYIVTKRRMCTLGDLRLTLRPSVVNCIHLSTAQREAARSIGEIHIPGEPAFRKLKLYLAENFGTSTKHFKTYFYFDHKLVTIYGAYLVDPLQFVRLVCEEGGVKALGSDCGGGITKIGMTYYNRVTKTCTFICLLAYIGHDKWQNMHMLGKPGVTNYTGETKEADCRTIHDVVHHFIDPSIILQQRIRQKEHNVEEVEAAKKRKEDEARKREAESQAIQSTNHQLTTLASPEQAQFVVMNSTCTPAIGSSSVKPSSAPTAIMPSSAKPSSAKRYPAKPSAAKPAIILSSAKPPAALSERASVQPVRASVHQTDDFDRAFVNGDWVYLNSSEGYKTAGSSEPCNKCEVKIHHFDEPMTAPIRQPPDINGASVAEKSIHPDEHALLTVDPERIVPLPLHVWLGLSNKIINESFSRHFPAEDFTKMLQSIKSVHAVGHSGRSKANSLNGPEVSKWLKKDCLERLITAHSATLTPAIIVSCRRQNQWIEDMKVGLLEIKQFDRKARNEWRSTVNDIRTNWKAVTGTEPTPKVHMLGHSVEFIDRFGFLGRLSESQLESYHMLFNRLYHQNHHNCGNEYCEKLRRCLADMTLRGIQDYLMKHGLEIPQSVLDDDDDDDDQADMDLEFMESDCDLDIESSDDEPTTQDE
jgi:TolA-binding protein